MLRRTRRGWERSAKRARGGRSPAWKTESVTNARRDATAYPGTRGSPSGNYTARSFAWWRNGCAVFATRAIPTRRRGGSAGHPLFRLSIGGSIVGHRGSLFIATEDLVNYLLSIYNILFATGGCCATAGRGKCGFTRWWLWKNRRKKKGGKKRTDGTRVV